MKHLFILLAIFGLSACDALNPDPPDLSIEEDDSENADILLPPSVPLEDPVVIPAPPSLDASFDGSEVSPEPIFSPRAPSLSSISVAAGSRGDTPLISQATAIQLICITPVSFCRAISETPVASGTACKCGENVGQIQ